jgi:small-conductance mechanosensitive channel
MHRLKVLVLFLLASSAFAAEPSKVPCSAVTLAAVDITCLRVGVGPFTSVQRAEAIRNRLLNLSRDPNFKTTSILVLDHVNASEIVENDRLLMSLHDEDLEPNVDASKADLARVIASKMITAIDAQRSLETPTILLKGVGYSAISLLIFILTIFGLRYIYPRIYALIQAAEGRFIKSVKIKSLEILNSARVIRIILWLARITRFVITFIALYLFVSTVLSFFPWTQPFSTRLYGYIFDPIVHVLKRITAYIPNLFFIAAIIFVTRYILKLIGLVFSEIGRGSLHIEGFYREWADPTYKLVRIFVFCFAFIMAFPYIPGSNSPAFQGISVFLGVLLSLGSSSAISNVVAGIVLTYMRPFKPGDRVKISDTQGDIIEKNLLVTRIRTIKNVDITIPNSMVLSSHIINYSTAASEAGLILNTTVTIGYDVPWRKVHELLKEAADRTADISKDRKSFVLQTALNDFSVAYEINAYTSFPRKMAVIYSELNQNIQDCFKDAGIEIMSPNYIAFREGPSTVEPAPNRS